MSIDVNISTTAIATASLRALSNYADNSEIRTNDCIAELFLPEDKKSALTTSSSREGIKKLIPPGMYEYVIARTKYFDSVFVNALENGIEQLVFLGAGFDSRAYRFNNLIKETKVFELDAKPTQEYKLKILQNNKIEIHPNIIFIPVNFENDDVFSLLIKNKYDPARKTLFLWEGVTFYLSKDSVTKMLCWLRDNSGSGSMLCFDFQTIKTETDLIETGLKDEVIKFGIESGNIEKFVKEHKYEIVEHLTSPDIENRFLTLDTGVLFGKIAPIMNFLLIEHK